jgi:osmotically-inducible protein OsmY
MARKQKVWAVPVAGLLVLALGWAVTAQEPRTTTEKIKEKVGNIGTSIKRGALSAEEAIKERYNRAKAAVVAMSIEGRVYARLHWDKALAGSKVELTAPKPGVIELSGTVADAKAKARALELTNDTVGVTQVVDKLVVQTSVSGGTAGAAPK